MNGKYIPKTFRSEAGYESLANAIIVKAADDYRTVLKLQKKKPGREKYMKNHEIEIFFRSKWFGMLTGIDPEYLIKALRREVWGSDNEGIPLANQRYEKKSR